MTDIRETDGAIEITSGEAVLFRHSPEQPAFEMTAGGRELRRVPLKNAVLDESRGMLRFGSEGASLAYTVKKSQKTVTFELVRAPDNVSSMRLHLPGEWTTPVFGGGGHPGQLNLRGKAAVQPKKHSSFLSKGKAEAPDLPASVILNGDGSFVYIECSGACRFDFSDRRRHTVSLSACPDRITLGSADSPAEYLGLLSGAVGGAPHVPEYCFDGVWVGVQGGNEEMLKAIVRLSTGGVKISALCVEDWTGRSQSGGTFWDWVWSRDSYPKLNEVIQRLLTRGVRVFAGIAPYFSIEGRLFAQADGADFLLKGEDGNTYIENRLGNTVGCLDLMNESARRWMRKIIEDNIFSVGFSGFFALAGDVPMKGAALVQGASPDAVSSLWTSLWTETCIWPTDPDRVAVSERTGGEGLPYLLDVDVGELEWASCGALSAALPRMLSLGLSGYGASFLSLRPSGALTPRLAREQFMRWAEFACFSPVMKLCAEAEGSWSFTQDDECVALLARMSKIHARLSPYIASCAGLYETAGLPYMRPMMVDFPENDRCAEIGSQYMLGPELLVAPALMPHTTGRTVVLPEGNWTHLFTGEPFEQGEREVACPFGSPPVFYRNGPHEEIFRKISENF